VDSFDKEPNIRRPIMNETRREDEKLQCKEFKALLQRVEEMELQHRKKNVEWKTLKKIQ